jgi:hypothetical protein
MFYSVPLTMASNAKFFELGVRQLAARIPFKGVAQRDAERTLPTLMKFSAAKLRICANQVNRFFYIESRIFLKIVTIRGLILKI